MADLEFNLATDITGKADKGWKPDESLVYDVLILGGGPASMAAAVYCSRKAMELAVIADEFGGQIADTSAVENYLGFQMIQGRELADRFLEHMKGFDIPCATGEKAAGVAKDGDTFSVTIEGGAVYRSHTVVVATGRRYRPLGVPGERELTGLGDESAARCEQIVFSFGGEECRARIGNTAERPSRLGRRGARARQAAEELPARREGRTM